MAAVDEHVVDLARFEVGVVAVRQATAAERLADEAEQFRAAVALWRGRQLSGLPGAGMQQNAVRLSELRLTAFEVGAAQHGPQMPAHVVYAGAFCLSPWVSDRSGVDRVEWWIDRALRSTSKTDFRYDFDGSSRTAVLEIRACDVNGYASTADFRITVDADAPKVVSASPANGTPRSAARRMAFPADRRSGKLVGMGEVLPMPTVGDVFHDVRGDDRTMRVSYHQDRGVFIVSLWAGAVCRGSFRLAADDVGRLTTLLSDVEPPHDTGSAAGAETTAAASRQPAPTPEQTGDVRMSALPTAPVPRVA